MTHEDARREQALESIHRALVLLEANIERPDWMIEPWQWIKYRLGLRYTSAGKRHIEAMRSLGL